MIEIISTSAPKVLQDYYAVLTEGSKAFGEGAELRPLLSDHLDFTGSLAGHHRDATEGFLHGVAGFIAAVHRIQVVRQVHDENGSAILYDAALPKGVVRIAEFFTFRDGLIDTLNLHYDGQEYIAKGGQ